MITDTQTQQIADNLQHAVVKHLESEIERIVKEEAESAGSRARERVAKLSSEIAAKIVANVRWDNPFHGTVEFVIRMQTK